MTEVYFATNRRPVIDKKVIDKDRKITDFSGELSTVDGRDLRYGRVDFAAGENDKFTMTVASEDIFVHSDRSVAAKVGSSTILEKLRKKLAGPEGEKKDIIVYIHGFNNEFHEGIKAAAALSRALSDDFIVFAFSWPSDGRLFGYHQDRSNVMQSGKAFARAIERVATFIRDTDKAKRCNRKIHLLAHSMGNQMLRHGVQAALAIFNGHLPPIIDQALLVAADEDADTFEREDKLRPLVKMCRAITVYHTPLDFSMAVSELTKGNMDRLGADGPENMSPIADKVTAVDVSGVVKYDGDLIDHAYYLNSPEVLADMHALMLGKTPPHRRPGAGVNRYRL